MKIRPIHPFAAATLGFVLAPLVPAAFMVILSVVTNTPLIASMPPGLDDLIFIYSVAEICTIAVGVPGFFLMSYFWKVALSTTLFAGFFIGVLAGLLFKGNLGFVLYLGTYGLFSAYAFWHIWQLRIGHPMHTRSKQPL